MKADELKRRATALQELERVSNARVGQTFKVTFQTSSGSSCERVIIDAVDDSHGLEVPRIAHRIFTSHLNAALLEYRCELAGIADVEPKEE